MTNATTGAADRFGRDAPARRLAAEPAVYMGAGRALVLQLAEPGVAAGVADHSDFTTRPFDRLWATLEATTAVVHGSRDLGLAVGRALRRVHATVTGPGYRANDPDLLLWVHATLVDSAWACHDAFLGPLDRDDLVAWYADMVEVGEVFGVPEGLQPPDPWSFREWWDERIEAIEVSDVGRRQIGFVLDPELPWGLHRPLAPLLRADRLRTLGTLPRPVRAQVAPGFGADDAARFERHRRRVAAVLSRTPGPVRRAPVRAGLAVLLRRARRNYGR